MRVSGSHEAMVRLLAQRLRQPVVEHLVDFPVVSRVCGEAEGKADVLVGNDGHLTRRHLSISDL